MPVKKRTSSLSIKKLSLIIVVIITIFVVVIFTAWNQLIKTKDKMHQVVSDDGNLVLSIPQDALPKGITPSQIKASKISTSFNDVPKEFGKKSTVYAAYQLSPKGLKFVKPISFTAKLTSLEEETLPVAYLTEQLGENSQPKSSPIEPVSDLAVTIKSDGAASLSGSLSHFSNIMFSDGLFAASISHLGNSHLIGESFPVTVSVVLVHNEIVESLDEDTGTAQTVKTPWDLTGKFTAGDKVSPTLIENAPPKTSVSRLFTSKKTFTCVKEGVESIEYTAIIDYSGTNHLFKRSFPGYLISYVMPAEDFTQKTTYNVYTKPFRCEPNTSDKIERSLKTSKKIKVIQYNGKYLPLDKLSVENEAGCGENHYHAKEGGVVTATDDTKVSDPGPQCGFGKVSQLPIIEIEK